MALVAFDTHRAVKSLEAAGAKPELAESVRETVATKGDVDKLRAAMRSPRFR